MPLQPFEDSTQWRLQTLEANLARVEAKFDQHMEKVDQRLAKSGEYMVEKLDEMRREMQLARLAMNELYVSRREHLELEKQIDEIHKERREDLARANQALILAGVGFLGSLILHFIPSFPWPGVK